MTDEERTWAKAAEQQYDDHLPLEAHAFWKRTQAIGGSIPDQRER